MTERGETKPTCHRVSTISTSDNMNFLQALKASQKVEWLKKGNEIEEIRKKIVEEAQKQNAVDIFISFKHRHDENSLTEDFRHANDTYEMLIKQGYKVFFSPKSLKAGDNFEAKIFNALNTARVFILVASRLEYIEAPWVRNEWSRFLTILRAENMGGEMKRKFLTVLCGGMRPESLPLELVRIQSLNLSSLGSEAELEEVVESMFLERRKKQLEEIELRKKQEDEKKQHELEELKKQVFGMVQTQAQIQTPRTQAPMQTVAVSGGEEASLLKKLQLNLEYREFDEAERTCKRIEDINAENGQMWWMRLLASNHCATNEELRGKCVDFSQSILYLKAARFSSPSEAKIYEEIISELSGKAKLEAETKARAEAEAKENIEYAKDFEFKLTADGSGYEVSKWKIAVGKSIAIIPSVYNGKKVVCIGDYAFSSCESLTSIIIPSSVTSIGDSAFDSCESLTSITIPSSVTSIGDYAFDSCESLTSITIPSSVTSIGNSAFWLCEKLKVNLQENHPHFVVQNGVLFNKAKTTLIMKLPEFKENIYEIPSSVTSIGYSAFDSCTSLTSITIPSSVTSIGHSAFNSCTSLTSITIPSSVTSIGFYAFYECSSLKAIKIQGDKKRVKQWYKEWKKKCKAKVEFI